MNKYEENVEPSVWNTRGWTFQERVHSRRSLIVTSEQVYWSCDGGQFCEESNFEPLDLGIVRGVCDSSLRYEYWKLEPTALTSKSLLGPLSMTMSSQKRFWLRCVTIIFQYTMRTLSYPDDVHSAFLGVTQALWRQSGEQFLCGHPYSRFSLSLSWTLSFDYPKNR